MPVNEDKVENNIVKGNPTKDFFITMLIKDISLRDAIGDLVDNSVDAIKAKTTDVEKLDDYSIKVCINSDFFSISDNGSGIEEEIARKYAFKLGKPKEHVLLKHSIGRFGIGMKRAFFKIGNDITVSSIAPKSRLTINIPVKTWRQNEDDWDFEFGNVQVGQSNPESSTGTEILIKDLSDDAAESFSKVTFENELIEEISREQILNISKGLKIEINENLLLQKPLAFKYDGDVAPAYWYHIFKHKNEETGTTSELSVEVYAGVDEEDEDEEVGVYFAMTA